MRRRDLLVMALLGSSTIRSAAQDTWPVRVSRFIVPFAPAGALDTPARMLAQRLSGTLAANFIVENRSGAGGAIGAQMVVQAPPDGGTFLFTSSSVAILPALQPNLGFDPQKDLTPVSLVCDVAGLLLVRTNSPFTSLPQLIAEARSAPRRFTYGSGGVGSSNHLVGAAFASMAGIELLHVPYRGTAQSLNGLLAGDIDILFAVTLDVLGHIGPGGTLRALGVSLPERLPTLPAVPAIAEFVPGYAVSNWFAIFAPARLPDEVRARLVQALASARDWPELQERFAAGAALTRLDGPAPLAQRLAEDTQRWAQLVAKLGIKAE